MSEYNFTIKNETPQSRGAVATLIARTYLADGVDIIELTSKLRDLPQHSASLAFIAEQNDKPVAYAMFTKLKVGEGEAAFLAPVALDERSEDFDYFAFLQAVEKRLKAQDIRYVMVHGDREVYATADFKLASEFGVESDVTFPDSDLMIKDLTPEKADEIGGKVEYPEFLL